MPFFFRNSEMEFFINGTMSGIKAAITDHLEMFFRDVPDKAFDKIHDRNGFLNVLVIFVTIVMEGNENAIIAVATFKNQAVNVRIPFEIPAKSMKNHDITGSEVFGFVHFKEHVENNTATEWKKQ